MTTTIAEKLEQVKQLNAKAHENTRKYPNTLTEDEKIKNAWKRIMEVKDKISSERYNEVNDKLPQRRNVSKNI